MHLAQNIVKVVERRLPTNFLSLIDKFTLAFAVRFALFCFVNAYQKRRQLWNSESAKFFELLISAGVQLNLAKSRV